MAAWTHEVAAGEDVQTAIDAAETNGGTVELGPGEHALSSTLNWKSGVSINGQGEGVTILKAADGTTGVGGLVEFNNERSFHRLSNLTIDLNKANTTAGASTQGLGIYFAATGGASVRNRVEHVEIKNGHQSGIMVAGGGSTFDDVYDYQLLFSDVWVHDCNSRGWWVKSGRGIWLDMCRAVDNGSDGILFSTVTDDTQARGCTAAGNGGHGLAWTYARNARCTGNLATGNGQWGILFGGGSDTNPVNVDYVTANNIARDNGSGGISADPTRSGDSDTLHKVRAVRVGNVVIDNDGHGMYAQHATHEAIVGNVSDGNGDSGVAVNGRHSALVGNVLTSNTDKGWEDQQEGLHVHASSAAEPVEALGNVLRDNGT